MRKLLHIRSKEPNPRSEAQASSIASSSSSIPRKVFSLGIKPFYEPAFAVVELVACLLDLSIIGFADLESLL